MTTYPTQASDAKQRAWRTLAQGLAVDVAVAVVAALAMTLDAGIEWTDTYWLALGGLVVKSALTAAASYLARHLMPPTR